MSGDTLSGFVTQYRSGFYTVHTDQGLITCHLRGRLRLKAVRRGLVTVGDRVQISLQQDGSGAIEAVEPRERLLVRPAPGKDVERSQALLANPDQIAVIFACADPEPRLRMLDRFLVICEKQGIPSLIIANKLDLVGPEKAEAIFSVYPDLGYRILYTSASSGAGIEELRKQLTEKLTGFVGPSGVGKTSLLNALQPGLGLAVRDLSQSTLKGRHATVVRELFRLDGGGYVADLPGLRSLTFWDIEPEELDGYFPELRPLVADCQFNDCSHQNEPGCAVLKAVAAGGVAPERYQSYLRMRFGDVE
ncbi:MAG: ribosome small subunit-dependent GTPase A [Anaerolineaceae bacterium]|nr:ribosome small subunit-dependent GTPase A [Anaerolineaceae bacterium]